MTRIIAQVLICVALLYSVSTSVSATNADRNGGDGRYTSGPMLAISTISAEATLSQIDSTTGKPSRRFFLRRIVTPPERPAKLRLAAWGVLSLGEGLYAYEKTTEVWGKPKGKFHFKHDLEGDGMALTDEASHLVIAYKLAQVARVGFRWCGLSPVAATRAGAIQAAIYMVAVEFPMDAYNPAQGFGASDFVANLVGIGLAWYRAGLTAPRWDLKVSVKSQFFRGDRRLIAHTSKQYDDYIYWLTYRVSQHRYNPIVVGVGYSTHHAFGQRPIKELSFRIGTSFSEIGRMIGRRTERALSPAEFYYWCGGPRLHWK